MGCLIRTYIIIQTRTMLCLVPGVSFDICDSVVTAICHWLLHISQGTVFKYCDGLYSPHTLRNSVASVPGLPVVRVLIMRGWKTLNVFRPCIIKTHTTGKAWNRG